jgi:iron-sulfur cluster assembly protein
LGAAWGPPLQWLYSGCRLLKAARMGTEVFTGGSIHLVTLTDIAATKVKELMNGQADSPEAGLRVAVRGGGCSGFQYALAFDEQREGDQVFEHNEIRLLVDSESLQFVDGSEVDYVEGLQGAGFSVNNPKVIAACGCGQSFRTA